MPVTRRNRRNSDDRGKAVNGRVCPSCATATMPEAGFCYACGAALDGRLRGGKWSTGRWAAWGTFAGLIAVAVLVGVMYSKRDAAPPLLSVLPAPVFDAPASASPNGPLDLSRMTQRQAADRLFNRIMTASEQGNLAEALRFVPMAVQAYGGLPALDRDARYHLGLIHRVAGDRANVDRQIAAMRLGAPNHLLALALEYDAANQSGDRAAVSRILAAFAAAYDTEIVTANPEYEGHRNSIERVRAEAKTFVTPLPAPD
ncbi:MAG: zinc ribbon domain-containing protein [Alphaproteobacteria bacterium]